MKTATQKNSRLSLIDGLKSLATMTIYWGYVATANKKWEADHANGNETEINHFDEAANAIYQAMSDEEKAYVERMWGHKLNIQTPTPQ